MINHRLSEEKGQLRDGSLVVQGEPDKVKYITRENMRNTDRVVNNKVKGVKCTSLKKQERFKHKIKDF